MPYSPPAMPVMIMSLTDSGGAGDGVAVLVSRDFHFPHDITGFRVERDEVSVEGSNINLVAVYRDTAIDVAATRDGVGRKRATIAPENPSGLRVESGDVARRFGEVHHPVHDERRRLDLRMPHLMDPLEPDPIGVVARDLGERGVAPSRVVARVRQPVSWLTVSIEEPFVRHLG